jgi:hypothetical protein
MDILVAFIMGAIGGAFLMAFITGASVVKREHESYMERFLAGKKEVESRYEI